MSLVSEIIAQNILRVGVPKFKIYTVQLLASVANNGSGNCRITVLSRMGMTAAHRLAVGDSVLISGIQGAGVASLNTTHTVTAVISASVFDTNVAYTGTPTANTGKFQQVDDGTTVYSDTRADEFSWPNGVNCVFATYCGGGQGGAGGATNGGGGGGGGASCTFRDLPIFPNASRGNLSIKVGVGMAGGAANTAPTAPAANAWNSVHTEISGAKYQLPTGRPDKVNLPAVGGAANGGAGGAGAPMYTSVKASPATGESSYGGPAGGTGGTGATPGQPGYSAIRRGVYGTTGGAGGGGGSTTAGSGGGSGGADDKHGDQATSATTTARSGGAGGGSAFGGAGYGATPYGPTLAYPGSDSNGYGGGGGGGSGGDNGVTYLAGAGGTGGDGIVILKYYV